MCGLPRATPVYNPTALQSTEMFDGKPFYPSIISDIQCGDGKSKRERGGRNHGVMYTDLNSLSLKTRPDISVDPGCRQIEGVNRYLIQHLFDVGCTFDPSLRCVSAVHSMEKFRRCDHADSEGVLSPALDKRI